MNPSLACGFSLNSVTRPPSMRISPKRPGGRTAVTVATLPWARWNSDELRDVHVGDAVTVGEQEGLVALDVPADRRDPAAGHGVLPGLGECHPPVLLAVPAVELDRSWRPSVTVTSVVMGR